MDVLVHLIHTVFDENPDLSPKKFNEMKARDQFRIFNLMKFEIRYRVLPDSGGDIDRLLKEIDEKLSDVLFG
jgi:hypothetical protein